MADIPQEVREVAARHVEAMTGDIGGKAKRIRDGHFDDYTEVRAFHAMFLAGKRAGMERAAEIADKYIITWGGGSSGLAARAMAKAIRSENDG